MSTVPQGYRLPRTIFPSPPSITKTMVKNSILKLTSRKATRSSDLEETNLSVFSPNGFRSKIVLDPGITLLPPPFRREKRKKIFYQTRKRNKKMKKCKRRGKEKTREGKKIVFQFEFSSPKLAKIKME